MRIPGASSAIAIFAAVLAFGCIPDGSDGVGLEEGEIYYDVNGYLDDDDNQGSDPEIDDWVGWPCTMAEEGGEDDGFCAGISGDPEAFCFGWTGAVGGICTKQCTFATYGSPVDGCNMDGKVCMDISALTADTADDTAGFGLCVEKCVPESNGTPCKADYVACDPRAWSFEAQFATCLLPMCTGDADCLVASGPECTGDGDCLTENGEYCSTDGRCVFEGTCNTASGLCSWTGSATAEIGDPCESSWDCPDNGVCLLPDVDEDDRDIFRNGYCVKEGCKAANTSSTNGSGSTDPDIGTQYGCGMLGTCHAGYAFGGFCFRRCTMGLDQPAFACRQPVFDGEILDLDGDYDCYDQHQFGYPIFAEGNANMYTVSPNPFCIFVSGFTGVKCGSGENDMTPADCPFYYGDNNANAKMACRDPVTGELDENGYCLDDTTSGPTGDWGTGDADTDADSDADTDADLLPPMEPCEGGSGDPEAGLCWQDPPLAEPVNGNFAADACGDLDWGGHDDWRLPDVQELISLLRGCDDGTETGGLTPSACTASDPDCLDSACNSGCGACDWLGGPGDQPSGCYWDAVLTGACGLYWTSSSHASVEGLAWAVAFDLGFAHTGDALAQAGVRCVRDLP